jgi:hypothetical protein
MQSGGCIGRCPITLLHLLQDDSCIGDRCWSIFLAFVVVSREFVLQWVLNESTKSPEEMHSQWPVFAW